MDFLRKGLPSLLFFALLIFAGLLLFSINYGAIQPGLDPSWGFAANQFGRGPLKFGVDLVFTYGPLAFLAVPLHVGNNIAWAAIAHVLVWCIFVYLMLDLWQTGTRAGAVAFVCGMIAANRLFYFYWDYFLTAIALLLFLRLLDRPGSREYLALLIPLVGLCFLVKFTAYIVVMTLLGIHTAWRIIPFSKATRTEKAFLIAAFLSGPAFYLFYNPSSAGLIGFLRGSMQESTGHSAAMSAPATFEIGMMGVGLCFVAIVCSIACALWKIVSPVGAVMTIALTWIAVKHGYVRSDPPHYALFCCFMIIVLAFLLAQIRYTPRLAILFGCIGILFGGVALHGASVNWAVWSRAWWTPANNLTQAARLLNWDDEMETLDAIAKSRLSRAPINDYSHTLGLSRVLFFPWEVAYGAQQSFTTVPLYSVQSYLAYTQYMDRESASHLTHSVPPIDYVFFKWESIDLRNPLTDVPATWNALFSSFEPVSSKANILLLKRRPSPVPMKFFPSSQSEYRPDAWVSIPERSTPTGLSISVKPTLAGTVLQTVYKLDAVYLQVQTRSGATTQFRVPGDNLSSPFPISSLPLSPQALSALWTRNEVLDPIISVRLIGPGLQHLRCDGYHFYDVTGTSIHVVPVVP
jgi:hypothetical protein